MKIGALGFWFALQLALPGGKGGGAVAPVQDSALVLEHYGSGDSIPPFGLGSKAGEGLRVAVGGTLGNPRLPASLLGEMLGDLGLDAVGLSAEDLARASSEEWRSLLASPKIPFLCSNVPQAGQKYLVRTRGGRRVAFLGVVAPPAYRDPAPSLGAWKVDPPEAALKALLPEVSPLADLIVLLAAMDRIECARLLRSLPQIALAIVPALGGRDPEPLKVGDAWVVQSCVEPGAFSKLSIGIEGRQITRAANSVVPAFLSLQELDRSKALYAKWKAGPELSRLLAGVGGGPAPLSPPAARLEMGKTLALGVDRTNRSAEVRFHAVHLRETYGGKKAPPGGAWLVVDSEWKNIIPMTYVFERQVPTTYKLPEAGNHLYLVVDGKSVARLESALSEGPGALLERGSLVLETLGTTKRGDLVFSLPSAEFDSLELRFYDYAHGHFSLGLVSGAGGTGKAPAAPILPALSNEVVELGVYGSQRMERWKESPAPEGMIFLKVDLRGRSVMMLEADATAFDPKAQPRSKMPMGTVADWKDARRHLHLVVDGEYACPLRDPVELPELPRFLPDVPTGATLVFLVPQKAASVELRADFPNAALPGGQVVHARPLTILLEGKRPPLSEREAVVEIDDGVFKVAVLGEGLVQEFGGLKPPAGQAFLLLDLRVQNTGAATESFQTREQLKYATEKGQALGLHEATFRGARAPSPLVLVPPGEPRSFQVLFAIPEGDRRPRLMYSGVTKAQTVNLRPFEAAASQPKKRLCPKCGREAGPKDKFCDACGTKLDP